MGRILFTFGYFGVYTNISTGRGAGFVMTLTASIIPLLKIFGFDMVK